MRELVGVGVRVTRPESQAAELTRLLAAAGAEVFHLPTLQTRACAALPALRASLGPLDRYRFIVFMSANAVRHGVMLLEGLAGLPLAAVGPATAAALAAAGHTVTLMPERGFTSEHLLDCAPMRDIAGARVLIVRGADGRDVLGDTLVSRGAQVTYADVYERACAVPLPGAVDAVERAWKAGRIHVVTATSGEVLRCLTELLTAEGRALAHRARLLVGGQRIASEARRMGFEGELIFAESPDSPALARALRQWRAGLAG